MGLSRLIQSVHPTLRPPTTRTAPPLFDIFSIYNEVSLVLFWEKASVVMVHFAFHVVGGCGLAAYNLKGTWMNNFTVKEACGWKVYYGICLVQQRARESSGSKRIMCMSSFCGTHFSCRICIDKPHCYGYALIAVQEGWWLSIIDDIIPILICRGIEGQAVRVSTSPVPPLLCISCLWFRLWCLRFMQAVKQVEYD